IFAPEQAFRTQSSRRRSFVAQQLRIRSLIPTASENDLKVERDIRVIRRQRDTNTWQAALQRYGVDFLTRRPATCDGHEVVPRSQSLQALGCDPNRWFA